MTAGKISDRNDTSTIQTFDDVLTHIGSIGRYQKFLIFILLPFFAASSIALAAQFFITVIPDEHWCKIPDFDNTNLTDWQKMELSVPFEIEEADGNNERPVSYSRCKMYIANYTEVLISGQRPPPDTPIGDCQNGWSFNQTSIPYLSISAELGWLCNESYKDTVVQSVFFVGCMIGALMFGYIGDRFGRLPSVVVCNGIGFFASIATAFCGSFWTLTIIRFITGMAIYNCLNTVFIIVMEYIEPKYRTIVSSISFGIYFAAGSVIFPWIAYWLSDWRLITVASAFPFAIVFVTPIVIPESARWCLQKGHIDRALKILKRFARVNKKNVKPEVYEYFKEHYEILIEKNKYKNYTIRHLFKLPRLRRNVIVLTLTWSLINFIYMAAIWNMQLLYSDVFMSYSLSSTCEFPAAIIVFFLLDKWGRRWMGFLSMAVCGIFSFVVSFAPVGALAMWIAIMARLGVTVAIDLNYQHATEVLPTVVRAQGLSVIIFADSFTCIFGPNVFLLASIHPSLPFVVVGILSFVTAMLILILPETTNQQLPESLVDGNDFGKEQSFWWFPCVEGSVKTKKEKFERNATLRSIPSSMLMNALELETL